MSSFLTALKSETTKLLTLRSTLVYFILLGGSIGGPVFLYLAFATEKNAVTWTDLLMGGMITQMIAVIFGASSTAGEIASKMHAQAFLTERSRWNWLGARAVVSVVFLAVTVAIAVALTILMVTVWPGAEFKPEQGVSLATTFGGVLAFALLAIGIAAIVRSRVAAVGLPLVWMLVIEPLIMSVGSNVSLLKTLAKFLPARTMQDIDKWYLIPERGADFLTPTFSVTVLAIWVIALLVLGFWRNSRADVR